jgi:mono/diheme cytochrome c family protein
MKINKILFLIPLTTTILLSQTTGEDLFKKNCAVCHATILGITNDGGYDNSYITPAPYVSDLVKKLKRETGSKEKFTEFMEKKCLI